MKKAQQPQVQVNQPNIPVVVQQPIQAPLQQQLQAPVQSTVQQPSTQNTNPQPPVLSQSNATEINTSTNVLEMTGFKLPTI